MLISNYLCTVTSGKVKRKTNIKYGQNNNKFML
jgi:hypothetical protein